MVSCDITLHRKQRLKTSGVMSYLCNNQTINMYIHWSCQWLLFIAEYSQNIALHSVQKSLWYNHLYIFSPLLMPPSPSIFLGGRGGGKLLWLMDRWTGWKQHVSNRKGDVSVNLVMDVSVNLVILVANYTHFDAYGAAVWYYFKHGTMDITQQSVIPKVKIF